MSGSKKLVELSDAEISDLCEFIVDVSGPARQIQCANETITVGGQSVGDCVMNVQESQDTNPTCMATVSNFEDCVEAFADLADAEICAVFMGGPPPAACTPLSGSGCGN